MPQRFLTICALVTWAFLAQGQLVQGQPAEAQSGQPWFVQAQESPDGSIEGTISAQLKAFRMGDVATAFSFASPSIRNLFGTAQRFGQMVQQGYPMVWRPDRVKYLELRSLDGALWQKVEIIDGAGKVHLLDYQMINTGDGWKINGVQLLRAPDFSV